MRLIRIAFALCNVLFMSERISDAGNCAQNRLLSDMLPTREAAGSSWQLRRGAPPWPVECSLNSLVYRVGGRTMPGLSFSISSASFPNSSSRIAKPNANAVPGPRLGGTTHRQTECSVRER